MIGDRIAAVAADTREAAEEAAGLIQVTYEDLPLVTLENALADAKAGRTSLAIDKDARVIARHRSAATMTGGRLLT